MKKKIIVNKWDTILIKWTDAASNTTWREEDDIILQQYEVNTVGMFLGEDRYHWLVCQNHGYTSGLVSDTMQIPKGMITNVQVLKRAEA